jgi:KDO2-lipid IV(A) lauroyltransferase
VGLLLYLFPNKAKKVSIQNIEACFPTRSAQFRQTLLKDSLIELAKSILELGPMWLWPTDKLLALVKEIHNIEPLEKCLEQKQGLFAATPHLGAWELCGIVGSSRYPFTAMYRPPRISQLEPWIIRARERAGAKLVDYGRQGIKDMMNSLRQGEVVGILPDQEPRDIGGVYAPFFGVSAYTMTLISKMARKTNAAVFFACMERLPRGQGYRLIIRQAEPDITSDDDVLAATALNASIEKCIEGCPEQYLWAYRRFKQRPDNTPTIYQG